MLYKMGGHITKNTLKVTEAYKTLFCIRPVQSLKILLFILSLNISYKFK